VLGLIFLRYADMRFTDLAQALADQCTPADEIDAVDYQAVGGLYVPEVARFSHLLTLTEGANLGKAIPGDEIGVMRSRGPQLRESALLPKASAGEFALEDGNDDIPASGMQRAIDEQDGRRRRCRRHASPHRPRASRRWPADGGSGRR